MTFYRWAVTGKIDAALCNVRSDPQSTRAPWRLFPPHHTGEEPAIEKREATQPTAHTEQQSQDSEWVPQRIEAAAAFIIFTFFHGSHLGRSLQPPNELTASQQLTPSEWQSLFHTVWTHSLLTTPMKGRVPVWPHATDAKTEAPISCPGSHSYWVGEWRGTKFTRRASAPSPLTPAC